MGKEGKIFSFKHFATNFYKSLDLLQCHLSWVIDNGATDHMCSNKELFFPTFHKLHQPHMIGLPDGHDASVKFYVPIHDSIILHKVLYVP